MPERLQQLYAAVGYDPVLFQECVVRPTVVDRLARSFFAHDRGLHALARRDAGALHTELLEGRLDASKEDARRTVVDLIIDRRHLRSELIHLLDLIREK